MSHRARSLLLALGFAGLAGPLAAAEQNGFQLSVRIDGAAAEEYAARDRVYIEALKGREFVVRLSNPGPERVAVALSVDGRNVIDAKRTSALDATKWILAPGQTIDIPGWQISGAAARKFFFTETSKSYAKWLGDTTNVGTIEAVFFREKRRPPVVMRKDAVDEPTREAGASGRLESPAPSAPVRAEQGAVGGELRRDRHRREDRLPRPVGRLRGGQGSGGSHRAPLRVSPRARPTRRAAARRGPLRSRPGPWLRARLRTRSVPALKPPRGFAVESRRSRPCGGSRL